MTPESGTPTSITRLPTKIVSWQHCREVFVPSIFKTYRGRLCREDCAGKLHKLQGLLLNSIKNPGLNS